jgi:hypothetical protein
VDESRTLAAVRPEEYEPMVSTIMEQATSLYKEWPAEAA